jgi:hypothetical protein
MVFGEKPGDQIQNPSANSKKDFDALGEAQADLT